MGLVFLYRGSSLTGFDAPLVLTRATATLAEVPQLLTCGLSLWRWSLVPYWVRCLTGDTMAACMRFTFPVLGGSSMLKIGDTPEGR